MYSCSSDYLWYPYYPEYHSCCYQNVISHDNTDNQYKKYASSTDLLTAVKLLKEAVPEVVFMATGLSAFGDLGAEIGAGGLKDGWFDIAGFGRQALAYPEYANDLLFGAGMDKDKCCFRLMDDHTNAGCIVRDKEVYLPLYQKYVLKK